MDSPYEIVLGAALEGLHPRLRAYFGAIPHGSVGRGHGTFDRVGTPKRWLWPALRVLGRAGIAFPAWQSDVPFDVENRAVVDRVGNVAVAARRTYHLSGGRRVMVDAITAEGAALVDHLGPKRRIAARLEATVRGGALTMRSTATSVRIGGREFRILNRLAPTVSLTERFDDVRDRQHVSVELRLPLLGRIYEYSGYFLYDIEPDTGTGGTTA